MKYRERRINEIPRETAELKKQKRSCEAKGWRGTSMKIQQKINELESEFAELYNSYQEERK